jgi:hypothetical protein
VEPWSAEGKRQKALTYISSYFSVLGGFFLVDRCNSTDNFLSKRTATSAEKIDNETLLLSIIEGLTTSGSAILGRWGGVAERDVNKEEKKFLAPVDFTVLCTGALCGFSDPEEYTHRMTSALMCKAVQ